MPNVLRLQIILPDSLSPILTLCAVVMLLPVIQDKSMAEFLDCWGQLSQKHPGRLGINTQQCSTESQKVKLYFNNWYLYVAFIHIMDLLWILNQVDYKICMVRNLSYKPGYLQYRHETRGMLSSLVWSFWLLPSVDKLSGGIACNMDRISWIDI